MPLSNILECIQLTGEDIKNANGKHVSIVRGEIVPYIRLRDHFNIRTPRPEIEQIMIAETEEGRYGFVVDEVLGDYQTVIKSLGRFYRHVQVVSGATILGNGIVALIVDPHRVVQDVLRQQTESQRSQPRRRAGENSRANAGARAKPIQNLPVLQPAKAEEQKSHCPPIRIFISGWLMRYAASLASAAWASEADRSSQ